MEGAAAAAAVLVTAVSDAVTGLPAAAAAAPNGSNLTQDQTTPVEFFLVNRVLFWILTVAGLAGNAGLLLLLFRRRMDLHSSEVFVVTLASVDLLTCMFDIINEVVESATDPQFHDGLVYYSVIEFVLHFSISVHAHTILVMTLDKLLAITRPLRHFTLASASRAKQLVAGTVCVNVVLALPASVQETVEHGVAKSAIWYSTTIYQALNLTLVNVVMCTSYITIWKKVRRSARLRAGQLSSKQTTSPSAAAAGGCPPGSDNRTLAIQDMNLTSAPSGVTANQKEKMMATQIRTAKIFCSISVCYMLFTLPFVYSWLACILGWVGGGGGGTCPVLLEYLYLLFKCNAISNPLIYCIVSRNKITRGAGSNSRRLGAGQKSGSYVGLNTRRTSGITYTQTNQHHPPAPATSNV